MSNINADNLKSVFKNSIGKTVTIANGGMIPITKSGSLSFPTKTRPLSLNNIFVTLSIIKNLIYIRHFIRNNFCSVEFDLFNFSMKDLHARKTILHSDSTGELYLILPFSNKTASPSAFTATITDWHRRLAHPSDQTLKFLVSSRDFYVINMIYLIFVLLVSLEIK